MILAAVFAVGVFLVGCGAMLGWWLRGDEVDAAFWSGHREALKALGWLYGTGPTP